MMRLDELLAHLESIAPSALAMSWDNVGLMIGEGAWEIHKAMLSLEVGPAAVEAAIVNNCDLILSHHPLIFRPLKQISDPLLIQLLGQRIAVISLHTNLDVADQGVNHALAAALKLQVLETLEAESGLGLVCHMSAALSLQDLAAQVKTLLNCPFVKLWTAGLDLQRQVQCISICGGSGASLISTAAAKSELLITGDVSYHSFLESPIPIIDAGHFYTEYPVLKILSQVLSDLQLPNIIMPDDNHEYPRYLHLI